MAAHSLDSVHHTIRHVQNPEVPYSGALVTFGTGVAVRLPLGSDDADTLCRWSGAEHLAGAKDLMLGPEGPQVLMPWCVETLLAFLDRRHRAHDPLAAGEVATLLISLVRGLAELGTEVEAATGQWWLSDEARPLFAVGAGPAAAEACRVIIGAVQTADRAVQRVLDEVAAACARPRAMAREAGRWEREIMECAAPRPLCAQTSGERRRVAEWADDDSNDVEGPEPMGFRWHAPEPSRAGETRAPRAALPSLVTPLAERFAQVATTLRFRGASAHAKGARTGGKARAPYLVAAGIAVLVLAVGILWPTGEGSSASSADVASDDSAATAPLLPTERAAEPVAPLGDGPAESWPGLHAAARVCVAEARESCPEALATGTTVDLVALVALAAEAGSATLLDDYGDVAVLSVAGLAGTPGALVVLSRADSGWLVRDLHEAPHQTGVAD